MAPDPEIDTEDRRLCSECVGELFLRSEIVKWGHKAVCSYCRHEGRTFSIAGVADAFEAAFEEHFYRTASEPSGMEYAMMKEGDYDWEREGDPVVDVISQCAKIEPAPAEDMQAVLQERHSSRQRDEIGEEGPFDEDAHYAERDVDDAESQAGWFQFEQSLKSQARYFSRSAEQTLRSIFGGIAEHSTADGRPIVVEAGPGKSIPALYRARVFQSPAKLEEALKRPDIEVGPPPSLALPADG